MRVLLEKSDARPFETMGYGSPWTLESVGMLDQPGFLRVLDSATTDAKVCVLFERAALAQGCALCGTPISRACIVRSAAPHERTGILAYETPQAMLRRALTLEPRAYSLGVALCEALRARPRLPEVPRPTPFNGPLRRRASLKSLPPKSAPALEVTKAMPMALDDDEDTGIWTRPTTTRPSPPPAPPTPLPQLEPTPETGVDSTRSFGPMAISQRVPAAGTRAPAHSSTLYGLLAGVSFLLLALIPALVRLAWSRQSFEPVGSNIKAVPVAIALPPRPAPRPAPVEKVAAAESAPSVIASTPPASVSTGHAAPSTRRRISKSRHFWPSPSDVPRQRVATELRRGRRPLPLKPAAKLPRSVESRSVSHPPAGARNQYRHPSAPR